MAGTSCFSRCTSVFFERSRSRGQPFQQNGKVFQIEILHNDLAASRFGVSPLNEVLFALQLMSGFRNDPVLEPWVATKRPRFDRLRRSEPTVTVLTELWDTWGHQPDFLAPPPTKAGQTVAGELEIVRATPEDQARANLARTLAGGVTLSAAGAAVLRGAGMVDRLADGLEIAWHELIEPDWAAMHAILQQDLLYRAGLLVAYGWAAALADLSSIVRWRTEGDSGMIEILQSNPEIPERYYPSDGRGLVFGPSIFMKLRFNSDPPWPRTVMYAARGRAALITPVPGQAEDALERLIGRTRASLLRALDQPATTTQLTRQYRISLGAAGHHLSALRASGLIIGARFGQSVVYRRTELGNALVAQNTT
jgi:DNA-binding transcriptional ArsR family regulator